MDEINEETQPPVPKTGCHNCTNPEIEPGYLTPLCRECRKKFSRYPILNSVKWAAAGVALLILISGYNLPRYFKAGVTYQKALKAEKTHHYITEKRLLGQVLQQFPDNFEAGAHYLMAVVRSDNFIEADSMLTLMANKKSDNHELVDEVNEVTETLRYYNLSDTSFAASISQIAETDPEYEKQLDKYCSKHSGDACAVFMLGRYAFNSENYPKADSLFSMLATTKPDFRVATLWLANTYREEKKYDEAIKLCEKILKQNAESHHALAAIAKILLKQKQDKEALQKATAAYELNPDSAASIYALAIADHFNNRLKERDQLLAKMKVMPDADSTTIAEMTDIFSGKISYR